MSKDLFSTQSSSYAKYRPGYPSELINYILSFTAERNAALDCATGNGQAAVLLAPHFQEVQAIDLSEKQLEFAMNQEKIHYQVADVNQLPFPDHYFDLVTVAQAYHWFNLEFFGKEAKRVLKPNGTIAIWGYGSVFCDYPALQKTLQWFYRDIVGSYWDAERKYVDENYQTIPFPFQRLPSRHFQIEMKWNYEDLIGYLNTWSAVQHYIRKNQINPVTENEKYFRESWPEKDIVEFRFPIFLLLGKNE